MDFTDRNNEKFTKLLEVLDNHYQVHFYYNRHTKAFKYWGITKGGFCPGEIWEKMIEQYIIEHHEYELRSLAEYEIKIRAGKSSTVPTMYYPGGSETIKEKDND